MRRVSVDEYLGFVEENDSVKVGGEVIRLEPIRVKRLVPSEDELTDTTTTVWSFPKRGSWGTHRGDYRGNWPPQMARAVILMLTRPGDTVIDPMAGSGTTCIEAKLLGRNCLAVDIDYGAVMLTHHRLYWLEKAIEELGPPHPPDASPSDVLRARVEVYHGDARSLDLVSDSSIDLVATHPPYFNIIKYGSRLDRANLARARKLSEYLGMLRDVVREAFRVLKPGAHLAILVGDTRRRRHYVPITHHALRLMLEEGFILREEVIKIQHKMKTTREVWRRARRDFLLIYHEKLFILRKPVDEDDKKRHRLSTSEYP